MTAELEALAGAMRKEWDANRHAIHKRPPFSAHSFDNDGRFWVVGSSKVSVLHGADGSEEWAKAWADALNRTPTTPRGDA